MTVLITLTTAGADSGPFDLYSNLDGYISAFESSVPKSSLVAGYSSTVVPDGTTTIRIKSVGICINYIDIILETTTTTTTTLLPLSSFHYIGIWGFGDEAHPNGGTIVYIDEFGNEQTITDIFVEGGCLEYLANSIVSTIGVTTCIP